MKIFSKAKDGGPDSPVTAFFICEFKSLFSIAFLKFNKGTREQFHTHAFNAYTWFLSGSLQEENLDGTIYKYKRSIIPKLTTKQKNHRVIANENSYCFTIRGPWSKTWQEYDPSTNTMTTFSHGRNIVKQEIFNV